MTETPLDRAFVAMETAPEDDAMRLRFYEKLAETELIVMLRKEPEGDSIDPEIFDLAEARFVLAFDMEERLAGFAGQPVPYIALSGRALVQMVAGQGVGLGVNLDAGKSSTLLPPDAIDWLAETLVGAPEERAAQVQQVAAPKGVPEALLTALDGKLARMAGLARKAYLAQAVYEDGTRGHLLGLTGVAPGAESALAQAVREALVFSGLEAGALDVVFLSDSDPRAAQLAGVALRFDLPEPVAPDASPVMPGSDPDKPPRLK